MKGRTFRKVGVLAGCMVGCFAAINVTGAATADPGTSQPSSPNLFLGDFATSGNGDFNGQAVGPHYDNNGNLVTPDAVTDGNLDTVANSTYRDASPVHIAIFAESATGPETRAALGSFGAISLIQLDVQGDGPGMFGDYVNGTFNGYNNPPDEVLIRYNYTESNPGNAFTINDGNFSTAAVIGTVNGVAAVTDPTTGYTSLVGATTTNSIGTRDNAEGSNPANYTSYTIDLGVSIPTGVNGVIFDFGPQPGSPVVNGAPFTTGPAGIVVNDIQAAIPEPTSMGLMISGGMFLVRRRSRQA